MFALFAEVMPKQLIRGPPLVRAHICSFPPGHGPRADVDTHAGVFQHTSPLVNVVKHWKSTLSIWN